MQTQVTDASASGFEPSLVLLRALADPTRLRLVWLLSTGEQPVSKLAEFKMSEHVTFPMLSDADKTVLKAYGAFGEKVLYGKTVLGVLRSTFVIDVAPDGTGTIEVAQYNVRAAGHVSKLRKELGV